MELPIKSIFQTSLIDYSGKLSTVIFVNECKHCNTSIISESKIISQLKNNIEVVNSLVISGNEPCIHGTKLIKFIKKVKNQVDNIYIKLDTNGIFPLILKKLIDSNVIDFISLNIKKTWNSHEKLTRQKTKESENIQKSVKLLLNSNILHEIKTTLVPKHIDVLNTENISQYIPKFYNEICTFDAIRPICCTNVSEQIQLSDDQIEYLQNTFKKIKYVDSSNMQTQTETEIKYEIHYGRVLSAIIGIIIIVLVVTIQYIKKLCY